jgi:hypothetical protein
MRTIRALEDKICTQKANRRAAGLGARADYFDMNIRGKIDTLMQKKISDYYRPLSHMQTAILEKYYGRPGRYWPDK